ncbi:EcsC protein family protein [Amphibacillus marinus]|uniref:EcsC protein family protein n=1 Tax=Amphibacillus marinus TaxID=872970 RepID=A0A1H8L364_9BACI|nr:EcsC family protein [Amphibacillus marinus]SEN99612.1 EcsC protein family protein [Amphibacillus marinus]
MTEYEQLVLKEIEQWRKQLDKRPGIFSQMTKQAQAKLNNLIPQKAHDIITESIKQMVKATLVGSYVTTNKTQQVGESLYEKDQLLHEKFKAFQKAAVIEGAGTGVGGFVLALTDFPLLLSIKIKFLFEAAVVYGYPVDQYEERMFILYVFQLAFSSDQKQRDAYQMVNNWNENKAFVTDLDWYSFQQEYRDYMDLAKLLQFVPGFGAIAGAYANHNLLEKLGETAKRAYQIRYLTDKGMIKPDIFIDDH